MIAEELNQMLIGAAEKGDLGKIEELVENGADINSSDYYGETALMRASFFGHLDIVQFLVENGADIDATDEDDDTAFDHATYSAVKSKKEQIRGYLAQSKMFS